MKMQVISNTNLNQFNDSLQSVLTDMENKNFILANIEYKPVSLNNEICFTAFLMFSNPHEERSKLSSALNIMSNGMQDIPLFR